MEIWKDIENYDGKYQVSNKGNIRSFSRWKKGGLLKGGVCGNPGPYKTVMLVKSSRKDIKQFYVHRLVAIHFIENPYNYSEVNHKDGDTLNNNVDNLEWCTRKQNAEHAKKTGLFSGAHENEKGAKNKNSRAVIQKNKDGSFVKEWESVNQIMREAGYPASAIFHCCNHRKHCKTAYGFIWEYKDGKTKSNSQDTETEDWR